MFPTDYGYFDYSIWDNTGTKGADKTNFALATGFREGQVASSENPGPFMLAGVNNWTAARWRSRVAGIRDRGSGISDQPVGQTLRITVRNGSKSSSDR
jgi:hypothetical protein